MVDSLAGIAAGPSEFGLTLLEPRSRFGDNPLKFQVVCPQNGTAVLKGLTCFIKGRRVFHKREVEGGIRMGYMTEWSFYHSFGGIESAR